MLQKSDFVVFLLEKFGAPFGPTVWVFCAICYFLVEMVQGRVLGRTLHAKCHIQHIAIRIAIWVNCIAINFNMLFAVLFDLYKLVSLYNVALYGCRKATRKEERKKMRLTKKRKMSPVQGILLSCK